jgi:hypothetical protein
MISRPRVRKTLAVLARTFAASLAVVLLVPMAVRVLAADPRFVNLDNAAKLLLGRDQGRADFVAHGMGCLVAAEAHHALNLQCAHSLLASEHEMGDPIPVAERLLGVLEDRPGEAREPITLRRAVPALPVEGLVAGGVVQVGIAATRTGDALGPAASDQVAKAGFIVTDRETVLELPDGHLGDGFGSICHGGLPSKSPWKDIAIVTDLCQVADNRPREAPRDSTSRMGSCIRNCDFCQEKSDEKRRV